MNYNKIWHLLLCLNPILIIPLGLNFLRNSKINNKPIQKIIKNLFNLKTINKLITFKNNNIIKEKIYHNKKINLLIIILIMMNPYKIIIFLENQNITNF
jgi:hypothetical protein